MWWWVTQSWIRMPSHHPQWATFVRRYGIHWKVDERRLWLAMDRHSKWLVFQNEKPETKCSLATNTALDSKGNGSRNHLGNIWPSRILMEDAKSQGNYAGSKLDDAESETMPFWNQIWQFIAAEWILHADSNDDQTSIELLDVHMRNTYECSCHGLVWKKLRASWLET